MAHAADYRVRIAGDDQGHEDVTIGQWDTLSAAQDMAKTLGAAGYDTYIEAELMIFDEQMLVNDMIRGGWGDHCFGELIREGDFLTPRDYKKCLFHKGGDGSKNIPIAWLDERIEHLGSDAEYVWRLLPGGIEHYLCNYILRMSSPMESAIVEHLRSISKVRNGWMTGYEARRL